VRGLGKIDKKKAQKNVGKCGKIGKKLEEIREIARFLSKNWEK